MLSFLLFVAVFAVLLIEGRAMLILIAGKSLPHVLSWALGFPLGAFLNVLVFFVFTLFNIPLTLWFLFIAHSVLLAVLGLFLQRLLQRGKILAAEAEKERDLLEVHLRPPLRKILFCVLLLSLAAKVGYGVSHAVVLPSFYFDSLSQWNMRAHVSFVDRSIAFDATEERGISKPQYPILLHSLQILFMLPQGEWKDMIANSATFLLTLTLYLGLFFLLKARSGSLAALFGLTLFLMLPLATMHLVQGYGDLPTLLTILLSAFFFVRFTENRRRAELLVSALFIAASSWVKQEGLFFGVLPWLIVTTSWFLLKGGNRKNDVLFGYVPAIVLGALWSVFLFTKGLPIGAHSGDFNFALHPEAIGPALQAMFSMGSFGIFFFVLPVVLILVLMRSLPKWKTFLSPLLILIWAVLTFLETLVVYLFTPNVNFLLNGQTFHRTMLIPLSLLILGLLLAASKILTRDNPVGS